MYRRSLILLWTGTIVFGVAATLDAFIDYMHNAQGALIAMFALMFVGAIMRSGFHQLNETARANGGKAEDLRVDVEQKSEQLRDDVDQLRQQVKGLGGTVDEVRDWAEAQVLAEEGSHPTPPAPEPEPDREPCPIYQLRVHDKGRDAIVGTRTPDPIDPASVWSVLEESDASTLPGTSAS